MRLQQVLTGSCNTCDSHASYGTLGEFSFVVYASGCDAVVLNDKFVRVQIIPGKDLDNLILTAISCSSNTGKIAIGTNRCVFIYYPELQTYSPVQNDLLNIKWCFHTKLSAFTESNLCCLTWLYESFFTNPSCGLVTVSSYGVLQLWCPGSQVPAQPVPPKVLFEIETPVENMNVEQQSEIWNSLTVGRVFGIPLSMQSSPDGRYIALLLDKCHEKPPPNYQQFATVVIWFPSGALDAMDKSRSPESCDMWEHVVLPHPCSVTSFTWRRSGRYLPIGWAPNALITSAEDNVCRIWVEVNGHSSTNDDQPVKSVFEGTDRLHTMTLPINHNHFLQDDGQSGVKQNYVETKQITMNIPPILFKHPILRQFLDLWLSDPLLPVQTDLDPVSIQACKHSSRNANGTVPLSYPRFACATTLCMDTVPASRIIETSCGATQSPSFSLYWLNNKVYQFDGQIKRMLLDSISQMLTTPVEQIPSSSEAVTFKDHVGLIDQRLSLLLSEWQHAPDVVLSVHPVDGSLVVWYIHGLDLSVPNPAGIHTEYIHLMDSKVQRTARETALTMSNNLGRRLTQVTCSLRCRLHNAVPVTEAASILPSGVLLYITCSSPQTRYSLQMLPGSSLNEDAVVGDAPMSKDILLDNREISSLFCRLVIVQNALENLFAASKVSWIVHYSKPMVLSCLAEIQLLWTSFDTRIHQMQFVAMVTRHTNGSLRYWRLDVSDSSQFQWIISMHKCACLSGHRFHTRSIIPHSLLPLLVTTSHYSHHDHQPAPSLPHPGNQSNSEIILWRVDPVGPLCNSTVGRPIEHPHHHCHHQSANKSAQLNASLLNNWAATTVRNFGESSMGTGGLCELARIDIAKACTWFNDLAWFPCLLMDSKFPYPVALFVTDAPEKDSDLGQLGFFLAFSEAAAEAKALFSGSPTVMRQRRSVSHLGTGDTSGCLMQLGVYLPRSSRDPRLMQSHTPDILLLHVFPSELIARSRPNASILPNPADISKTTYLIVRLTRWRATSSHMETNMDETQLEMWRVEIPAESAFALSQDGSLVPDGVFTDISKICDCNLLLPDGVSVVRAEVSAAHVNWAALSTFHAPPPYLILSACSDGQLRFWRCEEVVGKSSLTTLGENDSFVMDPHEDCPIGQHWIWSEWQMPLTQALSSAIALDCPTQSPVVFDLDCAYSGRIAVAYGPEKTANVHETGIGATVIVAIYECESSGGCEWLLEDTIDLSSVLKNQHGHRKIDSAVRIQLDWVSTEDGGHLLSILVGSRVLVYVPTCEHRTTPTAALAPSGASAQQQQQAPHTLMTTLGEVYFRWTLIASTHLHNAESTLHPISAPPADSTIQPVASCAHRRAIWLRDGLLLVGMPTELQLYSQWPCETPSCDDSKMLAMRNRPVDIMSKPSGTGSRSQFSENDDSTVTGSASITVAQLTRTYSAYLLKSSSTTHLDHNSLKLKHHHPAPSNLISDVKSSNDDDESTMLLDPMINSHFLAKIGLFESVQVYNPVLPQFHPRQLLEWLNLGRMQRVRVILAHLCRCLTVFGSGGSISNTVVVGGGLRKNDGARSSVRRCCTSLSIDLAAGHSEMTQSINPAISPSGLGASGSGISNHNLLDARAIPPVPLYVLLTVDSLRPSTVPTAELPVSLDPMKDLFKLGSEEDESDIFIIKDTEDNVDDDGTPRPDTSTNHPASRSAQDHPYRGMTSWSLEPASLANMCQFGTREAKLLAEYLATKQLPGLSPLDQMYLLGIADLMASTGMAGVTAQLTNVDQQQNMSSSFADTQQNRLATLLEKPHSGMDQCGLRFVLTVHLYSYLSRTLPPSRRAYLLYTGLTTSSLAWAYHSEAESELLSRIPTKQSTMISGVSGMSSDLTWTEFKRFGCGWWIRSDVLLRQCIEQIARVTFQATKDPMEAATFYLAMGKPKVVAGLFKSSGDRVRAEFFTSDFSPGQPACRQAKLNAYRLLSQHKYLQAAGLFLLVDCLDDAVRVCLDSMKDLQLAVVLIRLYTSSGIGVSTHSTDNPYHNFLRQHVLTSEDPFLRSIAFWTLGDPLAALQTLLEGPVNNTGTNSPSSSTHSYVPHLHNPQHPHTLEHTHSLFGSQMTVDQSTSSQTPNPVYPSVFKFYTFLRAHPLVLRQWRLKASNWKNTRTQDRLISLERRLYFRTAHHYSALGCPTLALEVLSKLPATSIPSSTLPIGREDSIVGSLNIVTSTEKKDSIFGNTFEWSSDFTTSGQLSKDDDPIDPFKIASSDSETEVGVATTEVKTQQELRGAIRNSTTSSSIQQDADVEYGVVDLIANQLKFIACLKILSEELSTLAVGVEAEGVTLRRHIWHWLEHELSVVDSLTNNQPLDRSASTGEATDENVRSERCPSGDDKGPKKWGGLESTGVRGSLPQCGPLTSSSDLLITLTTSAFKPDAVGSEFSVSNQATLAAFSDLSSLTDESRYKESERLHARFRWLKTHQAFLTSLVNYCGLYGASSVGLLAVRTELLFLLTELYAHPRCVSEIPTQTESVITHRGNKLPSATIGLVDGIPMLRTVLHLSPGALLIQDPVQHIRCLIQDIICCLETLPPPYLTTAILPYPYKPLRDDDCQDEHRLYCAQCASLPTTYRQRRVFLLRNQCAALAVCVHQALSTGGWFGPGQPAMEDGAGGGGIALPTSSSMSSRSIERSLSAGQPLRPNTDPPKWPGITSLRSYIRQKSSATPNPPSASHSPLLTINGHQLVGLLGQALVATYTGLIVYSLHTRDARALYRLVSARLDGKTWSTVFGGACRAKPARPAPPDGARELIGSHQADRRNSFRSPNPPRPSRPPPPRPNDTPKPSSETRHHSHRLQKPHPRDHALAAQKVASQMTGPPTDHQTSQRMRLLVQAEAVSIAQGRRRDGASSNDRSPKPSDETGLRNAPPPPDEWFVPPQCSMLSHLLNLPVVKNSLPDDPSQIFDSDSSETPLEYDSYADTIAGQHRRTHRLLSRYRNRSSTADMTGKRKARHQGMQHRTPKHSDIESYRIDADVDIDEDLNENDGPSVGAGNSVPTRWILHTLHLDPDFGESLSLETWQELCSILEDDGNEDDEDEEGDLDEFGPQKAKSLTAERQWADGSSYAWRLMRLAIMMVSKREIDRLTQLLDFSADDLAVYAPGLVKVTRLVGTWISSYRVNLDVPFALTPHTLAHFDPACVSDVHRLPPNDFIPPLNEDMLSMSHKQNGDGSIHTELTPPAPSPAARRAMLRMRHLFDPSNTPFQTRNPFSLPAKRLWCFLVRQPQVDDMFVRCLFREPRLFYSIIVPNDPLTSTVSEAVSAVDAPIGGRKSPDQPTQHSSLSLTAGTSKSVASGLNEANKISSNSGKRAFTQPSVDSSHLLFDDAIRLVHKEQDPLITMCVNRINHGCLAVATPKEIIELNIDKLVCLPPWYADEVEYDLELMRRPQSVQHADQGLTDDFVVLDRPGSTSGRTTVGSHASVAQPNSASSTGPSSQVFRGLHVPGGSSLPKMVLERSRRLAHTMLKRPLAAVYSLASHPTLPYYMSGTGTGSVHLFEWGASTPVVAGFTNTYLLTPAGASGLAPAGSRGARVTAMYFDQTGRRFGCGDADGNFGLWNFQCTSPDRPPYFFCRCHTKGLSDFCFVGSSTLIATVGNGGSSGSSIASSSALGGTHNSGVLGTVHSHRLVPEGGDAGQSSCTSGVEQDGANLALWDTLMNPRRCGVIRVLTPELDCPCTAVAHCSSLTSSIGWPAQPAARNLPSPRDRTVVVGTKRGEVCFVDLRQPRAVLSHFAAHESAIRSVCIDVSSDCLVTGGADGHVKVWRLSEPTLVMDFCGDFHQGRGAATVAALFRSNQSAAVIAATNPGIAEICLLPVVRGGSLLTTSVQQPESSCWTKPNINPIALDSTACRFLSCGADGGLRLRSLVMRPKPFSLCG